ncbi:Hypothetical protein R9X50_00555100 [Acrodontium crateriforme]|uniref:Copper transport protein n=1 Tax=Acrodontium crateriforme TaxID=150365 RepID=A0AAQ3RBM1_9PEZI|nr:Hypothetical protein R9X50_00555100 [Acrodontium crateriforme]
MDPSLHTHHEMNHGDMGHGDMGDMPMCSMNMLFTWDTTNLCIIFRGWRVTGPVSLFLSLLAVVALTAGYEALREMARRYELRVARVLESAPLGDDDTIDPIHERSSLLWTGSTASIQAKQGKTIKAALYGLQVFYSFFIMLLFMTYNGWIMLSVGVGAFLGYLLFGGASIEKSAACH